MTHPIKGEHWGVAVQMKNKHTQRCQSLLVIREIQIKTMRRSHYTSIKMAKIKKPNTDEAVD